MTNGFTTLIGITLLILIVLAIRFVLKHGSGRQGSCGGNCGSCGMGCTSAFSPERRQFEAAMELRSKRKAEAEDGSSEK
ncbi:MAG: FeoB-associated Cys-rich membrane protein [Stomatobaculum sp.]